MCGWKDRCRDGNLRTYCHVSPILFGWFFVEASPTCFCILVKCFFCTNDLASYPTLPAYIYSKRERPASSFLPLARKISVKQNCIPIRPHQIIIMFREPEVSSFQTSDLGSYMLYCLLCMEGKHLLGWLWNLKY